jgi:outer membrane immunogenic protein
MTKLRILALASVAALIGGTASAADINVRPAPVLTAPAPVAPAFSWDGLYLGLNGGYGWGQSNADTGYDVSNDGFFFGGQIGYNMTVGGNIVLGLEGDLQWADINGSNDTGPVVGQDVNWFGTARARVGLAMGNLLPYVTGGFAWANETRTSDLGASQDLTHTGYALGAGIEYAWTRNISTKLEYQYINLNSKTYDDIPAGPSVDQDIHTIRLGVNFRF